MSKSGLAHKADRHDAPGHAHVDARLLKLLGAFGGEVTKNLIERVGELVFAAVGGLAESLNLLQFLAAQIINMFIECQREPFLKEMESRIIKLNCAISRRARQLMQR